MPRRTESQAVEAKGNIFGSALSTIINNMVAMDGTKEGKRAGERLQRAIAKEFSGARPHGTGAGAGRRHSAGAKPPARGKPRARSRVE